jgi:hypothetical protein
MRSTLRPAIPLLSEGDEPPRPSTAGRDFPCDDVTRQEDTQLVLDLQCLVREPGIALGIGISHASFAVVTEVAAQTVSTRRSKLPAPKIRNCCAVSLERLRGTA